MVLYAHAFAFYGKKSHGFMSLDSFGGLGISIFFIISGYLIVKSWDSDPVWYRFLLKRSLRIFPALIVVISLTALILGPIFSRLNLAEYFSHELFSLYFFNILLYPIYALPGVLENARIPNAINGSLWSLPVEYALYLTVLIIGVICKGVRGIYLLLLIVFIATILLWVEQRAEMVVFYGTDLRQYFLSGIYFIIGSCYAKYNINRFFSLSTTVACLFFLVILSNMPDIREIENIEKYLMWVFLPYIILSFGLSNSWFGSKINSLGDYSYGVYIYAFPIQQLTLIVLPEIGFYNYLIFTSILTLIFAAMSWHFIEKKCLALKSALT